MMLSFSEDYWQILQTFSVEDVPDLQKTTFCKYWTLIKIKISMTCAYKGYEV